MITVMTLSGHRDEVTEVLISQHETLEQVNSFKIITDTPPEDTYFTKSHIIEIGQNYEISREKIIKEE